MADKERCSEAFWMVGRLERAFEKDGEQPVVEVNV